MKRRRWVLVTIGTMLAGCSTSLDVSYTCTPEGAQLAEVENGKVLGRCPTTITYQIPWKNRENGSSTLNGITATWPSGATATVDPFRVSFDNGWHQAHEFLRPLNLGDPKDMAAYKIDSEYGNQFAQRQVIVQVQQQQAQQVQNAALLSLSNQILHPNQQQPTYSGPTHCATLYTGPTSSTNCY